MTDKFKKNSNSDDINDFFAEFDKIDSTASSAPNSSRSSGSAPSRSSRSGQKTQSRGNGARPPVGTAQGKNAGKRGKKKRKKPVSKKKKVLKIIGFVILALILAVVVYVGVLILTADTHNIDADNIYTKLAQRSTIYDDRGKEVESIYSEGGNRSNVSYEDLPEDLINAIVSIEDRTFWDHHGFNFVRIMGAIKDSITGGGQISGTSTLTQQLARNVYLAEQKSTRSISRKVLEAYYAVLIEKNLTKEQILEAYLNTVYLGYNCYGVEAASQAYFNKSVKDLDLLECVALASLPQSPDAYALVKSYSAGTADVSKKDVLDSTDSMTYVYNGEASADRRELTLSNMVDQGYISQSEADKALDQNLKKKMNISVDSGNDFSSYFMDFAVDQIREDIMEEYGWSEEEADYMIYNGGLKIYTTMNRKAQRIVEKEYDESSNFPSVTGTRKDSDGNLLNRETGNILLYDYDNYFNGKNQFVLSKNEYKENSDGSITLYEGKRLNFYDTTVNGKADVSVEFKGMYQEEDGRFYTIENGTLSIPQGYKEKDAKGNCIISAKFFEDYPDFFTKKGSRLIVDEQNYSLKQRVVQPQSAMVITDYKTGGIKAMIGGREVTGRMLTNRATSPRQPGSSIKPLAVYSSALQSSYNAEASGESMNLSSSDGSSWGEYITAGSVINDAPMTVNGQTWPKNWYTGYRGRMTLRTAVQQSVNTCAVKTYQQMGPEFPVSQLKKMGITTVVEDGNTNDLNPAALALGGMTHGISPLEMSAAYGIFPNEGTYTEPVAYTKITNSNDEVLFDKTPATEEVLNEGVAFIMTDILRSVVTNGLGSTASFSGQPVAGKTGTTTDNFDAWFVGFTPQYSAALWIGNDVNIELTEGSASAARLWRTIMSQVCEGMDYGEYPEQPDNVSRINGEYYTEGTYSGVSRPSSSDSSDSDEESTERETTREVERPSTRQQTERQTTERQTTERQTQPTTQQPTTQAPTTSPPPTDSGGDGED